jgi:predicted HicB family RNase H-like nuclease
MAKSVYLSQWPALNVRVEPSIHKALERESQHRMLSVSALVREALDRAYKEQANE